MAELWGAETSKAVDNFPVSGERVPLPVVRWLGRINPDAASSLREGRAFVDVRSSRRLRRKDGTACRSSWTVTNCRARAPSKNHFSGRRVPSFGEAGPGSGGLEPWISQYLGDRHTCASFTIGSLEEEARRIAHEICAADTPAVAV